MPALRFNHETSNIQLVQFSLVTLSIYYIYFNNVEHRNIWRMIVHLIQEVIPQLEEQLEVPVSSIAGASRGTGSIPGWGKHFVETQLSIIPLTHELHFALCNESNNRIDVAENTTLKRIPRKYEPKEWRKRKVEKNVEDEVDDLEFSESDRPIYSSRGLTGLGARTKTSSWSGTRKRDVHDYPLAQIEYRYVNEHQPETHIHPAATPQTLPHISQETLGSALAANPLLAAIYLTTMITGPGGFGHHGNVHYHHDVGYNHPQHLPVNPYVALFLSHFGRYIHHPGRRGRGLYGYTASNNYHNNKPFGAYKIYEDKDN